MDANLRAPQQGQPARPSFRADRYHTEITIEGLLSQSVQSSGVVKQAVNPTVVLVVNNTGAVLPQFTAIGLGTPACLPTKNLTQFKQKAIFNAATTAGRYGVCQDAIQNGYIGRVIISGVTPAIGDVPGAAVMWTDGAPGGYRIVLVGGGVQGIIFKNSTPPGRQVLVAAFVGTPTDWINVHVEDGQAGLVEYLPDNTLLQNWPAQCMVFQLSQWAGMITVP